MCSRLPAWCGVPSKKGWAKRVWASPVEGISLTSMISPIAKKKLVPKSSEMRMRR